MSTFEIKLKPRPGLQEVSFRRYEKWIARACKGSVSIDVKNLIPPCKASSFMVGIRDAMRGFRLYDYKSTEIPAGYDVGRISVHETEDGRIYLRNEFEDKTGMEAFREKVKVMEGQTTVDVDENGKLLRRTRRDAYLSENRFILKTQRDEFLKMCEQIQEKKFSPWDNWVGVQTDGSDEENELIEKIWRSFSRISSEKLQHNWWMVVDAG